MKALTEFLEKEGFYSMTSEERDSINSKVFVDFHNADRLGRVRLNLASTKLDLDEQSIELKEGQPISMYQEQVQIDGLIQYSDEENIWVAEVDWLKNSEVISD